mmetsp:Transcript_22291/g.62725  ORF Transcript_22291/g.62725 Transcript_22291/m.62725 type:complete len:213 (-) Transcript_22291:443-1081(-)
MRDIARRPVRAQRTAPAVPAVLVERVDLRNVLGGELELDLAVLQDPRRRHGLRDDDQAARRQPADRHLGRGLSVLFADFLEDRVPDDRRTVNDRASPERRVGRHHDVPGLAERDKRLLRMIRMDLDLQNRGLDARTVTNTGNLLGVEVRQADAPREARVHTLFQGRPRLLGRRRQVIFYRPIIILRDRPIPLALLGEALGPVDQIQIEVVQP